MLYLPSVGSVNATTEDGIVWISTNPKKTRMHISHFICSIVVCIKNSTFSSKTLEYETLKHANFYTKPKSSELKRSSKVREELGFSQSWISSCVWDFWDWIGVSVFHQRKRNNLNGKLKLSFQEKLVSAGPAVYVCLYLFESVGMRFEVFKILKPKLRSVFLFGSP